MQTSNEKLRMALKECLEKDLTFIPSDNEIKKIYTPSEKFKGQMRKIIRHVTRKEKFRSIVTNKKKFYYAAAIAILILGLRIGLPSLFINEKSNDMTTELDSTIESAESTTTETTQDEAVSDSATQQSIAETESQVDSNWSLQSISEEEIILVIENNSINDWYYSGITRIEKMENDSLTVIYTNDNVQEDTLLSASKEDEILKRSDYNMNTSGRYILYRIVNGEQITLEIEIP